MRSLLKNINLICVLACVVIVAVGFFAFKSICDSRADGKLTVVFINVGDADSIFINMPNGKTALIDGGDKDSLKPIHDVLRQYKVKKIDYMINTHQHDDHLGSFDKLLKVFGAAGFYMPKTDIKNESLDKMLKEISNKNIPINIIKRGSIICDEDVKMEVLSPDGEYCSDENNYSAVILMTYGEMKFLFTGDAQKIVENSLVADYGLSECDVLKIAHHGSDTSSSYYFLDNIVPKYAIFSTGNEYEDRPAERITEILSDLGTKYFITRDNGNITMISDGKEITVKTQKGHENENR